MYTYFRAPNTARQYINKYERDQDRSRGKEGVEQIEQLGLPYSYSFIFFKPRR